MSTERIDMTIEVTIRLDKNGNADFEFYHAESGDFFRICASRDTLADEENRVGSELMSWLPLMSDMLDEIRKNEEEEE